MTNQTIVQEIDRAILTAVNYSSFSKQQKELLTKLTIKPSALALICWTTKELLGQFLQKNPSVYKEIAFIINFDWWREEICFTINHRTASFAHEFIEHAGISHCENEKDLSKLHAAIDLVLTDVYINEDDEDPSDFDTHFHL